MEETVANVRLEVGELRHHDITPNQRVCKEIQNVAVTAEEITENPEYVVMRRNIAVQTVTKEEVVIPKLDPAFNQASNPAVFSPEGGSTMEIDVSSQESVMDIASLESLSEKESNSVKPYHCDPKVSTSSQESVMDIASQESLSAKESNSGEPHYSDQRVSSSSPEEHHHCNNSISISPREELLMREEVIRKRLEALPECQEKMRILEEDIANRKRAVLQLKMEIQERQEMLNNEEAQLADQEFILKKLKTAIKIQELEAEGYKVIPRSNEDNDYVPVKRAKKN